MQKCLFETMTDAAGFPISGRTDMPLSRVGIAIFLPRFNENRSSTIQLIIRYQLDRRGPVDFAFSAKRVIYSCK